MTWITESSDVSSRQHKVEHDPCSTVSVVRNIEMTTRMLLVLECISVNFGYYATWRHCISALSTLSDAIYHQRKGGACNFTVNDLSRLKTSLIHTVYWHHFSHHFAFAILSWTQTSLCKFAYIQHLYSPLQCLNLFFVYLFPCIHNAAEDTTCSPNWRPKSPLFTPVRTQLKYYP